MAARSPGGALDELDRAIVMQLRRNARMTNTAIARHLQVTEKTVRNRIARLTQRHGLRVTVDVDDGKTGSRMLFLVHAEPGQRFVAAEWLAARPEVERVLVTTGAADLVVAAAFSDDAAAIEFYVSELEAHPAVRVASSCHVISEVDAEPALGEIEPSIDKDVVTEALATRSLDASPDQLLDLISTTARRALGADRILIARVEHVEPNRLRAPVAASYGLSAEYVRDLSNRWHDLTNDNAGVVPKVVRSRQHVFVPDALENPWLLAAHDLIAAEGYISALALPMTFGDDIIGVLGLYYDQRIVPSEHYIVVAQSLADHFATTLVRAMRVGNPRDDAAE